MARVRSTARVTHDGEEAEAMETAPISKVMRQSGLVVTEEAIEQGAPAAETEQDVEEENADEEEEEDYSILIPSKPSHLDYSILLKVFLLTGPSATKQTPNNTYT